MFCRKCSESAAIQNTTDERIEELQQNTKSEGKAGLLIAKQEGKYYFKIWAATTLNHEIAKHCLTKIKGIT
jgi:hypothetical protein